MQQCQNQKLKFHVQAIMSYGNGDIYSHYSSNYVSEIGSCNSAETRRQSRLLIIEVSQFFSTTTNYVHITNLFSFYIASIFSAAAVHNQLCCCSILGVTASCHILPFNYFETNTEEPKRKIQELYLYISSVFMCRKTTTTKYSHEDWKENSMLKFLI